MKWKPLDRILFPDFVKFVIANEWKSVSLSSRIVTREGNFREIKKINGSINCLLSETDTILGVIMVTPAGLILPMFGGALNTKSDDFTGRTDALLSGYGKITCILGTDTDVKTVRDILSPDIRAEVEYNLLSAPLPSVPPPPPPKGVTVKRAAEKEAESLFSLEEKYLIDEVLIDSTSVNRKGAMKNLKNNCINQILLYAETGGIPVAKANTNALGINYAQLGGIFTDYGSRRRGYSEVLVRALLYECAKLRKKSILFVKKGNLAANRLYLKTGFKKIDNYRIVYINL